MEDTTTSFSLKKFRMIGESEAKKRLRDTISGCPDKSIALIRGESGTERTPRAAS
jgi:transcriptional regulator with AAA-type ATPase domain